MAPKVHYLSPMECAARLFMAAKNKAPARHKDFSLELDDVYERVLEGHCERTGIPFDMRAKMEGMGDSMLPWRASLDRIDNARGYHADNIQVTSKIYNTAKWAWSDKDVLRMALALERRASAQMTVSEKEALLKSSLSVVERNDEDRV